MPLKATHQSHGAILAQDGIPLHYGDLEKEYTSALETAVLLDRSHEGRVQLFGKARYDILNRMSTNKMIEMQANEGRATIFTTSNARIIDRIVAYNRDDHLLMVTEPGRSDWLRGFLQKNIFFGDEAHLIDISPITNMFSIHGSNADKIMQSLGLDIDSVKPLYGADFEIDGATIYAIRRKDVVGSHWSIIVSQADASKMYQAIMSAGTEYGLIPAGSLTYNTLRIRAGRPARPELNTDYIPLEIGLWDEVNFAKGCYTGQEIIARMESRAKLAKTIVALDLEEFVQAPADISLDGRNIGKLTSSAEAPNGDIFAIAVIKTQAITLGKRITVGTTSATIKHFIGEQPDYINPS
ncbi:MAG: glycine cleavage T C-terminal barrel domain-containing protein [Phototrophicaceae bacterium]